MQSAEPILEEIFDVLVVGAGPAGLGVGIALKHAGLANYQILDRETVGSSFRAWPSGMQLITPSFPANSIGMLDLNSIAIGTSPGFSLGCEHPSGEDFATHLNGLSQFFELPTRSNTEVYSVTLKDNIFHLDTSSGTLTCKHLIWATGEFQFPNYPAIPGANLGIHNSKVYDWGEYVRSGSGDAIIIGGYESGIDAAVQLSKHECKSIVLARECTWESQDSDPSRSLSPFTLQRLATARKGEWVQTIGPTDVVAIHQVKNSFVVETQDGNSFSTSRKPILATGFRGGFQQIVDCFELRPDGYPLLNENDESTRTANLFLVGPSVRHEELIFCFIFKYRQRFGIVARAIAQRLGMDTTELETSYRRWGMFLDDLSCCGEQCVC
jgi:thioredoxin reductase